ncbi:hypothetical protein CYMTET_36203 [Cymbomonas tetramitiformis]|uniref:Uncharacterized protein n=1 Tax=Cymbomonas tetramitiformis TaxID=36881 RepID=A0AAE0CHT5_9CHLO|nr:hypothetical protein CYMTET_36203 [Cymbomonas tetramitiformis]
MLSPAIQEYVLHVSQAEGSIGPPPSATRDAPRAEMEASAPPPSAGRYVSESMPRFHDSELSRQAAAVVSALDSLSPHIKKEEPGMASEEAENADPSLRDPEEIGALAQTPVDISEEQVLSVESVEVLDADGSAEGIIAGATPLPLPPPPTEADDVSASTPIRAMAPDYGETDAVPAVNSVMPAPTKPPTTAQRNDPKCCGCTIA